MDAEVKRRLRGVSWRTSYRWKFATMLFHLFALSFVTYALLRTLQLIQTATYDLNWIYLDLIALLLFGIFLLCWRIACAAVCKHWVKQLMVHTSFSMSASAPGIV